MAPVLNKAQSGIGKGAYSVPEAALYTRVHANTIRSWFLSAHSRRGFFRSDHRVVDHRYAVSFLDMIDVWVVGELRRSGVSLQQIRVAHSVLRKALSTPHPFCHSTIFTDGQSILTDTANEIGDEELAEVVGGQRWFPKYMAPKLKQIEYEHESQLARRWRISNGVVVDPGIGLGKPTVSGAGTTTFVIARQFLANGRDADLVADLYCITPRNVLDAVSFENEFLQAA